MRELLQILIHIIAECCLFQKEGMAVHLAGEHGVYLFLSGPTEGLLDAATAQQTSCCNYESKPCRKSSDNDANYNSFQFFSARWDTLNEHGTGM